MLKLFPVGQHGGVFIYMDNLSPACGEGQRRVAITSDNPSHDSVLAAALAAKMSNASITLTHSKLCTVNSLSWDFNNFQIN